MKSIVFFIISILLVIIAIACDITVIVYQISLALEKYGVVFVGRIIIAHWSLWLLFGNVLFIPAFICFMRSSK